ncbi:MAG: hypothetical protein FJZ86_17370 [Chloroflexi bacterium]|nr:hypothetical protein [Chloroflexota bacterium]
MAEIKTKRLNDYLRLSEIARNLASTLTLMFCSRALSKLRLRSAAQKPHPSSGIGSASRRCD